MQLLILGLAIFLGVHSVRIFAEGWRNARLAAMGELAWKGVYSVVSLIGLVLIADGFGFHVPKGYIYAAMGFSIRVELLNMAQRNRRRKLAAA